MPRTTRNTSVTLWGGEKYVNTPNELEANVRYKIIYSTPQTSIFNPTFKIKDDQIDKIKKLPAIDDNDATKYIDETKFRSELVSLTNVIVIHNGEIIVNDDKSFQLFLNKTPFLNLYYTGSGWKVIVPEYSDTSTSISGITVKKYNVFPVSIQKTNISNILNPTQWFSGGKTRKRRKSRRNKRRSRKTRRH